MKVLVILGGISAEREVSLRSGANVVDALKRAGYGVAEYDPKTDDDLKKHLAGIDMVFPILHGRGGEDGAIQKTLEELRIPFVGSSSAASADCFDKHKTQEMLAGIARFPATEIVDANAFARSGLAKKPFVVKPIDEGSSIDTFIIKDVNNYDKTKVMDTFKRHPKMMLQELIEGVELTVPVLVDKTLPVIEIIPPQGKDFDYENKYNGATQEICPPANIPANVQELAQQQALKIHNHMGCAGFSRSDFILTKDGELYALEINTLPGMTKESLFPKSAKVAGIDIEELVDILVKDAIVNSK